jgi:hypothetical protein
MTDNSGAIFRDWSPFMRSPRRATTVVLLAAPLLLTLLAPSPTRAGDDHYWVSHDPRIGYALPYQRVYQFPAVLVNQPPTPFFLIPPPAPYPAMLYYQDAPTIRAGGALFAVYDEFAGPSMIPH